MAFSGLCVGETADTSFDLAITFQDYTTSNTRRTSIVGHLLSFACSRESSSDTDERRHLLPMPRMRTVTYAKGSSPAAGRFISPGPPGTFFLTLTSSLVTIKYRLQISAKQALGRSSGEKVFEKLTSMAVSFGTWVEPRAGRGELKVEPLSPSGSRFCL